MFVVTTFDQVPNLVQNDKREKHYGLWNSFRDADKIIIHQLYYVINESDDAVLQLYCNGGN